MMDISSLVLVFTLATGGAPNPTQRDVPSADAVPLYTVTFVSHSLPSINYASKDEIEVDLAGTELLPEAHGALEVARKKGFVQIEATVSGLEPPSRFGPEFLTYVLWAITPQGRATNLGELVRDDEKGRLKVTSELQAFALLVTAEPYFAVAQPSDVVVLENAVKSGTRGRIEAVDAKLELLKRGSYIVDPGNLPLSDDKEPKRSDLAQARNAVAIARGAGAGRYASDSFAKAVRLLDEAESARRQHADDRKFSATARQAVQTAEDARLIAYQRQQEQRLANERAASAGREAQATNLAEDATRARTAAEADRAAAESATATAQAALSESERLRLVAENEKAAAQQEKAELRAQLLSQLRLVLETRESARGLIATVPDVLFDTDRADLRPEAREKLAKVAGILLVHPGLKLEVEGHTDSRASEAYNQGLSERRGDSVKGYLLGQGIGADSISAVGFGESRPVATNDTPAGMQLNRRVEIVVSGEIIGVATLVTSELRP